VLQAQGGTYYGNDDKGNMIRIMQSGQTLWKVPGDYPQIATADGGVIGSSGTTYDSQGRATGQIPNMPIQSWTGNAYQIDPGQAQQVDSTPIVPASPPYASWKQTNQSKNSSSRKQTPTSLKVLSATELPTATTIPPGKNTGCTKSTYGIMIDIKYQVLDGANPPQPINDATMVPTEHIVKNWPGGGTMGGDIGGTQPLYPSSSRTTASDGTFHDIPLGICSDIPFNNPFSISQDINIVMSNGDTYKVRHNDFQISSTNLFNHGTITNGGDINVIH
jgi:hypothetical protein